MTDGLGISASTDLVFEENDIPNDQVLSLMEDYYGIETIMLFQILIIHILII